MSIDTNNINGASVGAARGRAASASPAGTPKSTAPEPDKSSPSSANSVELSSQAQSLGRIEASINASPDVDIDKVEAIKTAIAEGRFEINAEAIAEKMMDQEKLLG